MNSYKYSAYLVGIVAAAALAALQSCSPAKGERTGHEYMPDMAHSIAYEANIFDYYWYNRWGTPEELRKMVTPRMPVAGSIPRGSVGIANAADVDATLMSLHGENSINGISTPVNGNVPYYYADTEEERLRATKEIIANPFPITKSGLERGKALYEIYCGVCHGNDGKGNGYIYETGKYPAAPANLLDSVFTNSSNGRYYHAIMYGKNVMGSYKDKLSYEERWQVIHYIRSMQAVGKKAEYSETANTFGFGGVPNATVVKNKLVAVPVAKDSTATTAPAKEEAQAPHQH